MSSLCHSLLDAPKNLTVTVYQGADSVSTILKNGSSLQISEGQSLRLICSADSYPPANLSWSWGNLTLCPPKLSKPGLLELFPMHLKHEGVYTCQAQHALGSQYISLNLSPQSEWLVGQRQAGRGRLTPNHPGSVPISPLTFTGGRGLEDGVVG